MAVYLTAKAPAAIYRYTWAVPVAEGDSVSSATLSMTSGTASLDTYETDGDSVVLVLSGGAAGEVAVISASATTNDGETISETIYLPIIANTNALANTGQDIAGYVLRKVAGNGEDASADEMSDCLERLSDMLAAWKATGADIGIPLPLTTSTVFTCNDAFIAAIKANGIIAVSDLYEFQPSPFVIEQARRGLGIIKNAQLSREPLQAEYY